MEVCGNDRGGCKRQWGEGAGQRQNCSCAGATDLLVFTLSACLRHLKLVLSLPTRHMHSIGRSGQLSRESHS
eukprot:SAG31_NODE_33840_length_339_cov_1.050000_1_plen_71_part_01